MVRASADGVVLQTAEGFEALRCTGLPETSDGAPSAGGPVGQADPVGAGPQPQPVERDVTLSYLTNGFDWQANYIAELVAGRRPDLACSPG